MVTTVDRVFARLPGPIVTLYETLRLYSAIRGEQRAAASAYYALFSIVPLVALILSIGSIFVDPVQIRTALEDFAPITVAQREMILTSVDNLQKIRSSVSVVSLIILVWTSLRFFQAIVRAVNDAWRTRAIPWWQLPLKNLVMIAVIGSSLVLGIFVPAVIQGLRHVVESLDAVIAVHLPTSDLTAIFAALDWSRYLVSAIVLFYAFTMLYMLAPRCRVKFSEVWFPAIIVTILLQITQVAFISVLPHFIHYSEIYGSISSLMLLLFWIYISGQIIILGACFSATAAGGHATAPEPTPSTEGN
ncbi:MAG: YihY/virulence factor BrkB family protein [Chthoniobacterales bacterium]